MASGFSARFGGRNKLLVPFRGKALARHTLDLAAEIGFPGGIFFVTASAEVSKLARGLPSIKTIENNAPEKDLRESVRLGVEAAGIDTEYYLFFHCDQPLLDIQTVRVIMDARKKGCIVEPRCNGTPGNPCLFSAVFRDELISLRDAETPRVLKSRHPEAVIGVEVSDLLILADIDDEETLERLVSKNITL